MTMTEIKSAMSLLPHKANGHVKRFPLLLREGILGLVKEQGRKRVRSELGIAASTMFAWEYRGRRRKRSRFQRVSVVPEVQVESSRFVVEGPCGVRICGLSMVGLAQLIREVGHEF